MDAIFGMEFPLLLKFVISFAVVLILIGVAAYVFRRFGGRGLVRSIPRGRQPRLAVVDTAAIDSRRNLVIVRRDNVEHLLLIGGPTDVLVESNISPVPIQTSRDVAAAPAWTASPAKPSEPPPRVEPAAPVAAPEPRIEVRPQPAARTDSVFLPEPFIRTEPAPPSVPVFEPVPSVSPNRAPDMVPFPVLNETPSPALPGRPSDVSAIPAVAAALDLDAQRDAAKAAAAKTKETESASPEPAAAQQTDERAPQAALNDDGNLADMAQRLEAALRRPIVNGARPAPTPAAPPRSVAPPQRREPPPIRPQAAPPVTAPTISVVTPGPAAPSAPAAAQTTPASTQNEATAMENLQREMASLLGRKPGSS